MASITAGMVKELREKTGAGMMDCKAALKENDGDMEAASDWLRTKGLAKAAKKAGRVAADGLVGVSADGTKGAVVEVNSETDFVARNETFQAMVKDIAGLGVEAGGDLEKLLAATYPGGEKNVGDHVAEMVGTIGENMTVRRTASLEVSKGVVASYVHNAAGDGIGKIGVLVGLESDGDADKLVEFGRQVAMHVAAVNPQAVSSEDLDPAIVEKERTLLMETAKESGKPENMIEKIVGGQINKFYKEVCLLSQVFVIDGESKVEEAVEAAGKDAGGDIKITGFVRFELGEGIEKKEEDFAAEVAAAASGQ